MGNKHMLVLFTLFILLPFSLTCERQKTDPRISDESKDIQRKHAFDFGLQMGYASFQSQVPHYDASKRCLIALNHARRAAQKMKPVAARLPLDEIKSLIERFGYPTSLRQWNRSQSSLSEGIVLARTRGEEILRQTDRYWHAAYVLGANLAIAEAQFTEGEPAPHIVRAGLVNARDQAVMLDLDVTLLDEVIAAIDSEQPLAGHYRDMVEIRESCSAALKANPD